MSPTEWLKGLAARGVSVTLRNNRLWIHPGHAYKELADNELLFLRHNRKDIKTAVREGFAPDVASSPQPEVPTPAPLVTVATQTIDQDVLAVVNNDTTARDAEATKVMMKMVGRGVSSY